MFRRRDLLASAAATAAASPLSGALAQTVQPAPSDGTPRARLHALFDAFMQENLARSPEFMTGLGLDTGPNAAARGKLTALSLAEIERGKALNADQLRRLKAFPRASLQGADAIHYDTVLYGLKTADDGNKRFQYNVGIPYVLSQMSGAYQQGPDFLDSQHPIETAADAEAYLSRLDGFSRMLDQELEVSRHDEALGVIAPDFVIDKTRKQIGDLAAMTPDKAILVQSIIRRTKEKNIPGDWGARAEAIYTGKVQPALGRQIAWLDQVRAKATHDGGCWKLPDGEAYYGQSLEFWTSSSMPPEDIHRTGLELVAQISASIDGVMKANGMTQGTVGERLRGMFTDPKFLYPNTDEAKEKLIADLNKQVEAIWAKLPMAFKTLPKTRLEIRRVPKYMELGASGGNYQQGSLDGKRPGAYYINLRDTAEVPTWTLPTLTYHEGVPGHHLQLSLQQEADTPLILKTAYFSAYMEGWALYSEQLADEMGMYASDPFGRIGYFHDALLRAVRLVLDSGQHAKRWTREQSVKYFVETLGDPETAAIGEVERYCVMPGQACGYMLGKLDWLKNREKAKAALGSRFNLGAFHDAGLLTGAMPLAVLDQVYDRWIIQQKA